MQAAEQESGVGFFDIFAESKAFCSPGKFLKTTCSPLPSSGTEDNKDATQCDLMGVKVSQMQI